MRKALIFVLFLMIGLPLMAAPIKVGIAIPSADHGWTGGVVWWANKRVAEMQKQYGDKLQFTIVTADSAATQVGNVENLVVKGIDYLVILPYESAPLTPAVKEAQKAGVKVIVVDRGLTDTSFGYVNLAGDNPGFGTISGEWFGQQLPKGGNYVAMGGLPIVIDKQRMDGFFAGVKKANPTAVNLLSGTKYEFADWSTQKGLSIMENFLQKYSKIDAVFCQDDDVLLGVLQAIKESGRKDIKLVMGGAGSKVVMKMIMDGDPVVRATTTYHPRMIADGIDFAVDVALGKKADNFSKAKAPVSVIIPSVLLVKANVAKYYQADSIY